MPAVPCTLIRGGTSRGACFLAEDLPGDPAERDALLVRIMGGPDALQVDGIGGGHPLTSKVAVIAPSARAQADGQHRFASPAAVPRRPRARKPTWTTSSCRSTRPDRP